MAETFEEFLKKEEAIIKGNEKEPSWHGQFKEFQGFKNRLGEWAWAAFEESLKVHNDSVPIKENIEIAIFCLGKEEIGKRLKKAIE